MLVMLVHYKFTVLVLETLLHIFVSKMLNQSSSYRDGCRLYLEVTKFQVSLNPYHRANYMNA